jgi:hypothetical protein
MTVHLRGMLEVRDWLHTKPLSRRGRCSNSGRGREPAAREIVIIEIVLNLKHVWLPLSWQGILKGGCNGCQSERCLS